MHPGWTFNNNQLEGNIAILVLTETVELSPFIQPICLAQETDQDSDRLIEWIRKTVRENRKIDWHYVDFKCQYDDER